MEASRQFKQVLKSARNQEVLIPRLRAYLFNQEIASVNIVLDFTQRKPDGWFHPSEHPLWSERMLYYYLTTELVPDAKGISFVLAVTRGTFWHHFILQCMLDAKLLTAIEAYVEDKELGSRGSMDGIIDPSISPDEIFELKTISAYGLSTIPKGSPASVEKVNWFKTKHPTYYAQTQEYLRMSGYSKERVLFLCTEYPFGMSEIVIPFSYTDATKTSDKYRRVRQMVADQVLPDPCCGGGKSAMMCPARQTCPIGLL